MYNIYANKSVIIYNSIIRLKLLKFTFKFLNIYNKSEPWNKTKQKCPYRK